MLYTERLVLKPVEEMDVDVYRRVLSSDSLTQFLPKGAVYSEPEILQHHVNRVAHWRKYGFGSYVICCRENPNCKMGYAGVEVCENPEFSDIRYALLSEYQGKGYVTEASKAVIAATFKLGKHEKIYGVSLEANKPSVTILNKLGMRREVGISLYGECDGLVTFSIDAEALEIQK